MNDFFDADHQIDDASQRPLHTDRFSDGQCVFSFMTSIVDAGGFAGVFIDCQGNFEFITEYRCFRSGEEC
jgi:hypothetical protein